jgi:RNA polymerase sigma-70 factor (ECF subfamily)
MRDADHEDARRVIQAQCGDRDALEHVVRRVQPPLRRYVQRLVGATAADDVLQEVLISIARKRTWLVEPRLFRAWAHRVASRAAFDHLRKEKRRGRQESDDATLEALVAPASPPSGERLCALLDSPPLSPASRAVLMLHFQEEMSVGGVVRHAGEPIPTAIDRDGCSQVSERAKLLLPLVPWAPSSMIAPP